MEDYCKIYIEAECSKADLKSYVMANLGEIFGEVNDVHVFVDKNDSTEFERREPRD